MKNKIFKHTISSTHKHLMFVFTFAFAFFCNTMMTAQCQLPPGEARLDFNIEEEGNSYSFRGILSNVHTSPSYNFKVTIDDAPRNMAEQGPRGGISFHVLRNATPNPEIDPVMMAHLLWRDEVIELLDQAGYAPKDLRRPRKQLYEMLCETMNLCEITASIRTFMLQRPTWRDRPAHV